MRAKVKRIKMSDVKQIHTAFTDADVTEGKMPHIYTGEFRKELIYAPPEWLAHGLQQTASGYGPKLNSGYMINFNGKLYRVYITQFSNAGSAWFEAKGKKYWVS